MIDIILCLYSGRVESQAVPIADRDLYSTLDTSGQIQQTQKNAYDNPIYGQSYETVVVNNDYEKLDHFRDTFKDNVETHF